MQTTPPPTSPQLATEAIVATLQALVRINSVNPAHEGPAEGQRAVLDCAAALLVRHGVAAQVKLTPTGAPLLRATLPGQRLGPPLVLESHVDTVSVAGMTIAPFEAEIRDGRLWGRGSTDAKGQCAAMLHAVLAWAESIRNGMLPLQAVELVLVTDEEFGFTGAESLLADGLNACGIVIGEPTGLRVVTSHKGTVRWWVRCEGRSAHGAKPHLGLNAISVAAKMIEALERELLPRLATRSAPLLAAPTINIGRIEGGIQVNLVPPLCRFQIDRRIIPGEHESDALHELDAILQAAAAQIPGCRVSVEPATLSAAPLATATNSALARAAGQAAAVCGVQPDPIGVDYATDASVLAATGLPIVVAGPGSIDQAHTADEFISLDDLAAGARFYTDLIGRALD
jgi:acetylornithine deacetylase